MRETMKRLEKITLNFLSYGGVSFNESSYNTFSNLLVICKLKTQKLLFNVRFSSSLFFCKRLRFDEFVYRKVGVLFTFFSLWATFFIYWC
jgi:hypothetical protein